MPQLSTGSEDWMVRMRIALIHAVAVAIEPINSAFERLWPDAERMNLLDDTLSVDRAKSPDITSDMFDRIRRLAVYGRDAGAQRILFTCSAFGPAIAAANEALDVPVLKPNDAMFEASLGHGRRIGLLASFQPSVAPMEQEFRDLSDAQGAGASLETVCVPDAMTALREGKGDHHDALLADAARDFGSCDAIMLAQFSTARAQKAVEQATGKPVLTSPESAVKALLRLV